MAACDSPFCAIRKELIESGGRWLWWLAELRTGEVLRLRLLRTWVCSGPDGPYLSVARADSPEIERRLELSQVRHLRPEID